MTTMKRFLPLVLVLFFLVPLTLLGADWYHWRGPWQTGVSPEKGLPDRWSPDPDDPKSNLIWKAPYGCRSTPLVMNGRVYLINKAGEGITEQERVMCLDANTGKKLWEHRFNVWFADIVSVRLGWANLAGDPKTGNIYAHGTQGMLFCFDKDGNVLWSHSLIEEYGRFTGYGGRVTTPTLDEELLIIGMVNSGWGDQKGGNRWLALDKLTGTPVWWAEPIGPPRDSYYSVPVVGVIGGERLLIGGGAAGYVVAMKVRTGEKVWTYPLSEGSLNSAPVIDGNLVYATQGIESPDTNEQGRVVCLDASKVSKGRPALVWKRDGITARYASPIIHEGRLYVADDTARLYCLDAGTGKTLWSHIEENGKRVLTYGGAARGSPVLADGKIYVGAVNSRFSILEPGPKKCKLLHKHFFPSPDKTTAVEINGSPAVANGRVYFSTSEGIYCIGKKGAKSAPEPESILKEEPAPADAKPAHLQVVPADLVIYPGESAAFKAKVYDAQGRFLRAVKAEWSLPPLTVPGIPGKTLPALLPGLKGAIEDGTLTVAKDVVNQQGFVQAKAEGLQGIARVRVPPKLPYFEDFERYAVGTVPPGWVNAQGKYVIATLKEGGKVNKVLKKVNTKPTPLVSRGNTYFGMPNLTDYTVQADVMGTKVGDDMPEIGIVANRYMLSLAGNKQQLRITSWEAIPRLDRTIAFSWQPKAWYRMKLTVEVGKDQAVIRGRVWPRDEKEPDAWTIDISDPSPNREGSPALYGYVTGIAEGEGGHPGTDVYYDNVRLTSNKK
jgi:outer membrane protein assembly factor BamB